MATIRFDRHPAFVTVSDGLSMAASYWAASWERWVVPVVAVAIANGLVTALLSAAVLDTSFLNRPTFRYGSSPFASYDFARDLGTIAPALVAGSLLTVLITLVAGWYLTAVVVAGLRGRRIDLDWVLGAGLRSLVGLLLAGFVYVVCTIAYVLLVVVTGGLALLALVGLIPAVVYVVIRMAFWTIAIFDGAGIVEGFERSWAISRDAVLRMLGWGLLVAGLGLVISIGTSMVTSAFNLMGLPAIGGAISAGFTTAYSVFSLTALAILYESQRWRMMPPPMPGPAAAAPVGPSAPTDHYGPPPPPPRPPVDPWGSTPPASWPGSGQR
jgi:hypothetical protein